MPKITLPGPLLDAVSSKAEIGLAKAMRSADAPRTVANFIKNRLQDLAEADILYISALAQFALDAAEYINGLESDQEIDLNEIPVNGNLFGDDTAGKRLFWSGEWNIPGTDEWYQFSGTLPDVTGFDDLAEAAFKLASGYIERYPNKFEYPEGSDPGQINVRFVAIERGF